MIIGLCGERFESIQLYNSCLTDSLLSNGFRLLLHHCECGLIMQIWYDANRKWYEDSYIGRWDWSGMVYTKLIYW